VSKKKRALIGFAIIIALIAGGYLYSQYDPEESLFFPKCPVYTLTGYECPGCGSQRAFHNLFHGEIAKAFMYNPLMMLIMPYILLGVYIEYIANRNASITIRLRNFFYGKWAVLVLGVVIVLFTLLRNIL
jgi:Protein of unknown function (DUF2752).